MNANKLADALRRMLIWDGGSLELDGAALREYRADIAFARKALAEHDAQPAQAAQPSPEHQQLLGMLGAKDQEDAARIIAEHHARELAQPVGVPDGWTMDLAKEIRANAEDHPKEKMSQFALCWADMLAARAVAAPQPPAQPHPEDSCERCGGKNIKPWFAPSPIWNRVADNDWSIICPQCFVELAREVGIDPTAWRLAPEDYAGPNDDPSRQAAQPVGVPDADEERALGVTAARNMAEHLRRMRAESCSVPVFIGACRYVVTVAPLADKKRCTCTACNAPTYCAPRPPAQPSADAERLDFIADHVPFGALDSFGGMSLPVGSDDVRNDLREAIDDAIRHSRAFAARAAEGGE